MAAQYLAAPTLPASDALFNCHLPPDSFGHTLRTAYRSLPTAIPTREACHLAVLPAGDDKP